MKLVKYFKILETLFYETIQLGPKYKVEYVSKLSLEKEIVGKGSNNIIAKSKS